MTSAPRVYDSLEEMLVDRGVVRREDGSFAEDSYDYGVWWSDERRNHYRLTWIGPQMREPCDECAGSTWDTPPRGDDLRGEPCHRCGGTGHGDEGELYLVRLTGAEAGKVLVLATIPPADGDDDVDRNVEAVLDGWADVCGTENSIEWVATTVRDAIRRGDARLPEGEPHA